MIYYPILGALALATGTIIEKIVLRKKEVGIKLYQTAIFFAIILVMLPFVYFFWRVDSTAFELKNIFIFIAVILSSLIANILVFYSMKWEKINNLEPARMLEPLFIISLAIIFSFFIDTGLYDRNPNVIIPAFIAGMALIFSHLKKHHLEFNKYFTAAIFGSFFFALELIISRLILDYYSPLSFYFLRCSVIFLLSLIIFMPKFEKLSSKIRLEIFAAGVVWVIYRLAIYYGYLNLGVVFTTLMIMLGPIFIYAFARIFLKEKLSWRNITASIIILLSVLYVVLN